MDGDDKPSLVAETERAIAESEELLQNLKDSELYVRDMTDTLRKELAELRRSNTNTSEA